MKIKTVEQRNTLMVRWSIILMVVFAGFWITHYLITGHLASITEIVIIKDKWIYTPPFTYYRIYDVLLIPIYVIGIIQLFYKDSIDYNALIFGFGFGFVFGLVVGLVFFPVVVLVVGFVFWFVFLLGVGVVYLFRNFKPTFLKLKSWALAIDKV